MPNSQSLSDREKRDGAHELVDRAIAGEFETDRSIRREGDTLILPVGGIETVADEMDRLRAENERLREALVEYGQHNSWRCAHAPHYYLVGGADRDPELGCPCGLDRELRELALASTTKEASDG